MRHPLLVAAATSSLLVFGLVGTSPVSGTVPAAPATSAHLLATGRAGGALATAAAGVATTPVPALSPQAPSANSDADNDGLVLRLEVLVGTNPNRADTDRDGIIDGGDPDIVATVVARLPNAAFASRPTALRKTIRVQLDRAEAAYARGRSDLGKKAMLALRARLDGCPPRADRTDWISRCSAQLQVRQLLDLVVRNHSSARVDSTLRPAITTLPPLRDGDPVRRVAVVAAPDGTRDEFVDDEVIVQPQSRAQLDRFLARYGGTVVSSGAPHLLPGTSTEGVPSSTGWYLVRIDPSRSALTDLNGGLDGEGLRGTWRFSSTTAARLTSLLAREDTIGATANGVASVSTVPEHPTASGFLDAATWWWMTEDDDPNTPGNQGLSTGVIHAWDYLRYKGFPPLTPFYPVRVAEIDTGFDLDPVTGAPITAGPDFMYSGSKPDQIDEVDGDWTAGGPGSGFSNCNGCWHGQMTFGVCCGNAGNQYGTAGISGGGTRGAEVKTLFIRVTGDFWTVASGVYDATYNNATVINMSIAGECGWACRTFGNGNVLKAAVGSARNHGTIVVASAGNASRDVSNVDMYPCTLNGAVCVGAVDQAGRRQSYSNYGSTVDIWAPAGILTTVTRVSAAADADNVGADELALFHGTSCSAPYITGVVALMKALHPDLTYDEVRSILASTANASTDPLVAPGYVDVYRAVEAAATNQPPTVAFTAPAAGATVGYEHLLLSAHVDDPEASGPWAKEFSSRVTFRSDRDGALCTASGISPDLSCETTNLSQGAHTLTVTATDPFDATATASRQITVSNQAPTVIITNPPNGATLRTSQQVNLHAVLFDPDETLDGTHLTWTSSRDGNLGTGIDRWVTLTAGTHVITATATDSFGAKGSASVTVVVEVGAGYPTVQITSPADRSVVSYQKPVTLTGVGTDAEDGTLTGTALRWTDDVDGALGTGTSVTVTLSGQQCSQVIHHITLTGTDSDGHVGTHTIQVAVVSLC